MKQHQYALALEWTGNAGAGTRTYAGYSRDHVIRAPGKPEIAGSSDPAFRGDGSRWNPEELLLAAISACHMLSYLHLCAVNQIVVESYRDAPTATMEESSDGSGRFLSATVRPYTTISAGDAAKALDLHHQAHQACFIANSLNFEVTCEPTISSSSAEKSVQA